MYIIWRLFNLILFLFMAFLTELINFPYTPTVRLAFEIQQ